MRMQRLAGGLGVVAVVGCGLVTAPVLGDPANLVANGDFEEDADGDGVPDGWLTAGRADIEQELTLDDGRDGGKSARLSCTHFVPGTPDAHAMVCQVGVVSIKRGQWYRLSFWTKSTDLVPPVGQVAVSNTKPWGASGVAGSFPVGPSWRRVEFVCQGTADVAAENSRLQFWYASTGTLWLDEVVLEPIEMEIRFHPEVSAEGVRNLVPNSSFECGSAGWGSYAPELRTWTGNAFRLLGEIDDSSAYHGRHSLRMHLARDEAPVYYFDYFDPVEEPLLTVVAAHEGWARMQPGKPYVLSCYLKADRADVPAVLLIHESNGAEKREVVSVGGEWERFSLSFTPSTQFVWAGAGLDLREWAGDAATLWLDAVQLELAEEPSEYAPRGEMESVVATRAEGNVFTKPDEGLTVYLHAWNGSGEARVVAGRILVTDFLDEQVASIPVEQRVGPRSAATAVFADLVAGRRGFYRVAWRPEAPGAPYDQSLRCALIDPYEHADSPFGMNHAFGWSFLLRLSKLAGLTWMRDWSVMWHTVEPKQGTFDFTATDPQIDRVVADGLNVLMLFPFPSAPWCSEADPDVLREVVGEEGSRSPRYIVAWRARDDGLFREYIARSARHYSDRISHYEIMNEPLYTTYSVPARFGYEMEDYLDLLRTAYEAVKEEQADAKVLGGIGTWAGDSRVHGFVQAGGLRWCDIMDIHLYPVTIPPEVYERDLLAIAEAMEAAGGGKPLWLTEFGCYADDDPHRTPGQIGDSAMSRANWSSERAASEGLVKSAAVFLARGVAKIFYHAGTCAPINSGSGGNVFFEYGGAPRKMYPALNALARLLGPHPEPLPPVSNDRLRAYLYRGAEGTVAVVWAVGEEPVSMVPPDGVTGRDLMGNPVGKGAMEITSTPCYLLAESTDELRELLGEEP